MTKALIRAGQWLDADSNANRKEAAQILSQPEYVGADVAVIANSMTGTFEYEKGDKRRVPDFNVFFRYYATYPYYSDAVWYLTQMRRWGQIAEGKPDAWYVETAKKVYRPDIYLQGGAAAGRRGQGQGGRLPLGQRRLPRAHRPTSSTASTTTAASPTTTSRSSHIGLKGDQKVDGSQIVGAVASDAERDRRTPCS